MMEWHRTCSISLQHMSVDSFWADFSPHFLIWLGQFSFVEGEIEDELKEWCYFIRILLENGD